MKDLETILRKYVKEEDVKNILDDISGLSLDLKMSQEILLFQTCVKDILDDMYSNSKLRKSITCFDTLGDIQIISILNTYIFDFKKNLLKSSIEKVKINDIFSILILLLELKCNITFTQLKSELSRIMVDKRKKYRDSFDKEIEKFGLIAPCVRIGDKCNMVIKYIYTDDKDDNFDLLREAIYDFIGYLVLLEYILQTQYQSSTNIPNMYTYNIPFDKFSHSYSFEEKINWAVKSIEFNEIEIYSRTRDFDFSIFKSTYIELYDTMMNLYSNGIDLKSVVKTYYNFCNSILTMIAHLNNSCDKSVHLEYITSLLIERNKSYSNSFHIQYKDYGITAGFVRLDDKYNRIINLYDKKDNESNSSSLLDSFYDLLGYSILLYIELFMNA